MADATSKPTAGADAAVKAQSELAAAVAGADTAAATGLQTIGKLHQARVARLTREAAASSAKGATLAAAQAELASEQTTAARVAMLAQRAATAAPAVSKTGWALHGRLYDSSLAPAAGCTVFLVDAQNAYQEAYGFAYTDATGYFALAAAAQAAKASGGAKPDASTTPAQLFVAAADAKGEPVYRSPAPFTPTPGVATYQTHILPAGGGPIGDPPAAIRGVALPKAT